MAQVDPFIVPLPQKLALDPQTGPYFQYLQKFLHDLWQRTGAGQDLIDGSAQLTADQTFSGDTTFSATFTVTGVSTFSGAFTASSTANFTGAATFDSTATFNGAVDFTSTVDFDGDVDVNDALYIAERAAADGDKAGFGQLWVKSDSPDTLYFTDDNGTDYLVSGITSAFKNADTSRALDTSLVDDPDLSGLSLDNNAFYKIEAYIGVRSASAVPDFKWSFQFSQVSQGTDYRWNSVDSTGGSSGDSGNLTDTFNIALTANDVFDLHMIGYFRSNATTGGTIDFQWAQNTSDGTSTDVLEGSWLQVTKLGDA